MPNPQVVQGGSFAFKVVATFSDGSTGTPPFPCTVTGDNNDDVVTMASDGVTGSVAAADVGTVNLSASGGGFSAPAFPLDIVAPAPTVTGLAIEAA